MAVKKDKLAEKLKQDVILRWTVIVIGLAIVIPLWLYGAIADFAPIFFVTVFVITFNTIYTILLSRDIVHPAMDFLDSAADIIVITLISRFTGGMSSPFTLLYLIVVLADGFYMKIANIIFDFLFIAACYNVLIPWKNIIIFNPSFLLTVGGRSVIFIVMAVVVVLYAMALARREGELIAFSDISTSISAAPVLTEVIGSLIDKISGVMNVKICGFMLCDEKGKELRWQHPVRLPKGMEGSIDKYHIKLDKEGITAEVFKTGKPYISLTAPKDPLAIKDLVGQFKIGNILIVPLKVGGKTIGVLHVANKRFGHFTRDDIALLPSLAAQAAVIIENARLYEGEKENVLKLKELDRMKTEFMSMVSHELRTPLTSISGFVSHMLDGKTGNLTETQTKFLKIVKDQSKHLESLIGSLLDFSRIETGKLVIITEPVNLGTFIKDVVNSMQPELEGKELKLKMHIEDGISAVLFDQEKIRRVISNLIGNAIKFTPSPGSIEIAARKEKRKGKGKFVEISVADTGIGVRHENLKRIFYKFYQVDSSMTRAVGGMGMGLSIAKEIVRAHGGKIWAESEGEGRGSKFIFTLPLSVTKENG
ncbi:MAG: ATP-binding protein [Candidatus Saganbacteria bacterium]|nr:ATP-binding protein [Candidatus Saganbacteria bacterium]